MTRDNDDLREKILRDRRDREGEIPRSPDKAVDELAEIYSDVCRHGVAYDGDCDACAGIAP